MKLISAAALSALVRELATTHEVFAPREVGGRLVLGRRSPDDDGEVPWNACRLSEPLKPVWFRPGCAVARWPAGGEAPAARPRVLLGAKACDLRAVGCLDRVLRDHDYRDPAWCAEREATLIVAGDCTDCADSCFCTMLGGAPHPDGLFDLCLSPTEGGYLVETGSERGERLVEEHAESFSPAEPQAVVLRERARAGMRERVRRQNQRFPVRDPFEKSVAKHQRTGIWAELAATCVECGACNMVCPTCHCFLLHDVRAGPGAVRLRLWDSCFSAGHARMAGGLTPRLQLTERFRNHYEHKFVTFPRNWGVTACTGCGRCIEACMGGIDKRRCLHELETRWLPSEVAREID